MAVMPENSTSLELTISIPGSSSSLSLPSSGENGGGMRDLDINQVPSGGEEECMEEEDESPAAINGDGTHDEGPPRKKLRLTKEQSLLLEDSFRKNHTLNPKQKEALATQLKLRPRQVEVWFQNRRARSKLKQTEMECEYLKRWFGSLTEQNRRLQKEVEELRAMKVAPPTVMASKSGEPLSTVVMCPRCERVTTSGTTSTATTTTTRDKVGPTGKNMNVSTNPTLSAKVQVVQPRHPSAAC